METVRIRSRLIAMLAVVTLSFGVGTAGSARADDSGAGSKGSKGTCILMGARLVGSSGGRYNLYELKVRLINRWQGTGRITAVVSDNFRGDYRIGATIRSMTSATRFMRVNSPHGSTFRVTGCSWSSA